MFINRSIKQDFCYRLWAQCSSPVTGVKCRVKNNNSLTCLNDDTEPTHAFPWGHVPVGEKTTVLGSSCTSNNTNNFSELMLLQVVKNPPDALCLWKKQLMALEEPSMQEGKGWHASSQRQNPPVRPSGQGAGFEADTQGLSMAIEAPQFCAELEREFRWIKSCTMAWVCCASLKRLESLFVQDEVGWQG